MIGELSVARLDSSDSDIIIPGVIFPRSKTTQETLGATDIGASVSWGEGAGGGGNPIPSH